jgi:hypothetical protein
MKVLFPHGMVIERGDSHSEGYVEAMLVIG